MGQSFTIRILPSRSRMVALISPTFSLRRTLTSFFPSRIAWRASRVHVGQSESVSRGQPSGGFVFSYDFNRGLSDHAGMNDGFCCSLFRPLKTTQAPLAATTSPFSKYLIGACMRSSCKQPGRGFSQSSAAATSRRRVNNRRQKGSVAYIFSERAQSRGERASTGFNGQSQTESVPYNPSRKGRAY